MDFSAWASARRPGYYLAFSQNAPPNEPHSDKWSFFPDHRSIYAPKNVIYYLVEFIYNIDEEDSYENIPVKK